MDTHTLLNGHRLLNHPFYRRWEEGCLQDGELSSYAAQYRYFEAQLPSFLEGLEGLVENDEAKALVAANLADEVGGEVTHLELFENFATAVDATTEEISPAMAALIETYRAAVAEGDAAYALGVLAGYEVQASEVAMTKGAGLRAHYGVTGAGLSFWDVHGTAEADHAAWTLEASTTVDSDRFVQGANASAAAWWSFLNERDALVAA